MLKNIYTTVEPRVNERPRDWPNVSASSRFFFIYLAMTGVKKIVRYTEVRYIEVPVYNFALWSSMSVILLILILYIMMMMMMMILMMMIIPIRSLLVMVNWALYQGPWEHDPTSSEARETLNHFTGRRLSN